LIAGTVWLLARGLKQGRARSHSQETSAERQLWFLPLFIAGFEGVGNLSQALQCHFGAPPQYGINNLLLATVSMVIMLAITLASGVAAQSLASFRMRLTPPAGAVAATVSVVTLWCFVAGIVAKSGMKLVYVRPTAG
jgi:hypothetical protein